MVFADHIIHVYLFILLLLVYDARLSFLRVYLGKNKQTQNKRKIKKEFIWDLNQQMKEK